MQTEGRRWRDGRGVEVDLCTPDAAEGVVGEGVNFLCGVAVNDASAERDHDARMSAERGARGEAQICLCIRACRAERPLRPREDDRAVDMLKHIVEGGGGVRHGIRAVGDNDAVVCLTAVGNAPGDLLPVRWGDVGRVEGEEVERLHSGVFQTHRGAQVVCGECGTQTAFRFPRSNGAARGDQQNFFHECSSFFSRRRER